MPLGLGSGDRCGAFRGCSGPVKGSVPQDGKEGVDGSSPSEGLDEGPGAGSFVPPGAVESGGGAAVSCHVRPVTR